MTNFDAFAEIDGYRLVDLARLALSVPGVRSLPVSRRVLLEFLLRNIGRNCVTADHVRDALQPCGSAPFDTLFQPTRILMQDYAGMAALVDLAALRTRLARDGIDPSLAAPRIKIDLVVDHSLILHDSGPGARLRNLVREIEDNTERYGFLKWAEQSIDGLTVVPSGEGIVHQLNMERFARPAIIRDGWLMPDTVLGTDSHTTMINGLGTLGWGVGGIEAMAAMMGVAMGMRMPRILGLRLIGERRPGVQASDIALTLTEALRARDVVDHVIEVFGPGAASLTVEDRATVANMCPEYGATACLFPADDRTLNYFSREGHDRAQILLARRYLTRNGLWTDTCADARYDDLMEFDISSCALSAAGPVRPDQRHDLLRLGTAFEQGFPRGSDRGDRVCDGDIVLAAITSCTNTANPDSMIAAGLVAQKARALGLVARPGIKCTMTLGSKAVRDYLDELGLLADLEAVGFHVDGFGCGACVGNAGLLKPEVEAELAKGEVSAVAVLSGNRNFPGRIHPNIRANYLTSPAAVVALAIAGQVRDDLGVAPIGHSTAGDAIMFDTLWPTAQEIEALRRQVGTPKRIEAAATTHWAGIQAPVGPTFAWNGDSTYLVEPPFLDLDSPRAEAAILKHAVPLLILGDAITTDHISPVGPIARSSDAGSFLVAEGVTPAEFNTYGARRGNHHVMARGTFDNPRLQNRLTHPAGPRTRLEAIDRDLSVFEAAEICRERGQQSVVIAGKSYGAGSARDWAAKGTRLLGVRAVIAESFERIHRANLICAGVLPLQVAESRIFEPVPELRLSIDLTWAAMTPGLETALRVQKGKRAFVEIPVMIRADSNPEVAILRAGGLLPLIHSQIAARSRTPRNATAHPSAPSNWSSR